MRVELLPRQSRRKLTALVKAAYARLDAGEGPALVAAALSEQAGVPISDEELHGAHGAISPSELAADPARPPAHVLRQLQLTREELIEVTRRWLPTSDLYDPANEAWWTALFDANVPHPAGSGVADQRGARSGPDRDLTPEEIVDLACSYRPFAL